jgi:hypothetical protein
MKQLFIMGITLLLLFALANCGDYPGESAQASETDTASEGEVILSNELTLSDEEMSLMSSLKDSMIVDPIPEALSFTSLKDLVNGCKTAKEGGDITKFVSGWGGGSTEFTLADHVENLNFAALDIIYFPTNIPKPYRLYGISVYKDSVSIRYLRGEHLDSEFEALFDNFVYNYSRLASMDDILRANYFTNKDLIDGKYLLSGTRSLRWVLDGRDMSLDVPASVDVFEKKISLVAYLGLDSVEDLARFTEVDMIELG